jgi:hypothetical protein
MVVAILAAPHAALPPASSQTILRPAYPPSAKPMVGHHRPFNSSSGGQRRRIGRMGIDNSRRPATNNNRAAARLARR